MISMTRTTTALRLLLPAFLLGAIIAISFLEAPLKFLAPGVTIPIGLGIGRLVFTALNVLAGIVLLVLTVVSVRAKGRSCGTGHPRLDLGRVPRRGRHHPAGAQSAQRPGDRRR
jgi:hypothetical protein